MRRNSKDVEPTVVLAQELGAAMFAYTPLLPMGRGAQHFKRWNHDAAAIHKQEQELRAKYPRFLQVLREESVLDLKLPGGCGAGYRT
jgi:MoaA/NifB/PqqE/SkfB family radical SAM enzyme